MCIVCTHTYVLIKLSATGYGNQPTFRYCFAQRYLDTWCGHVRWCRKIENDANKKQEEKVLFPDDFSTYNLFILYLYLSFTYWDEVNVKLFKNSWDLFRRLPYIYFCNQLFDRAYFWFYFYDFSHLDEYTNTLENRIHLLFYILCISIYYYDSLPKIKYFLVFLYRHIECLFFIHKSWL